MVHKRWPLFFSPVSLSALAAGLVLTGTLLAGMWNLESSKGELFPEHFYGSLTVSIAGVILSLLAAAYIAEHKRAEHALQLRERAIEASANAIIIANAAAPGYVFEYVNPAFERMTGYSAAEVVGRNCAFLWGGDRNQPGVREIRATARDQREGHAVLRCYHKNGTLLWSDVYIAPVRDVTGAVNHFVVALYDITATKRYESELEFQANRDILTGLANRNLLHNRLRQTIVHGKRHNYPVWVVFVDLDRFKFINDTLGHKAGDVLLGKIAERLLLMARETDTVARFAADEFVLVLSGRAGERTAIEIVPHLMDVLAQPMTIEGHEFFLTCSVGVAAYPNDGEDADVLIKHAEIAMYRAKETGRNNFQFYTPAMNAQALERLRIEGYLRTALERGEFMLHYQPQIDLRTGRVVGMESLLRWRHAELGMVPPAQFIGLAEETGLIASIGAWVTRVACQQRKAWQESGFGHLRIAVNLSARQFFQQNLVQSVAMALEESGLAPEYLEIELTESVVMTDVERAITVLRDLKALGIHISIDDFGTGYSSLSYLKRFPIDVLKIDQSFVRDLTIDPDDAAIVLSIISLAHSLRLQVIAEGVETPEQLAYLRENGCDQMQGFLFSKPVAANELTKILEQGKCLQIGSKSESAAIAI